MVLIRNKSTKAIGDSLRKRLSGNLFANKEKLLVWYLEFNILLGKTAILKAFT